MILADLVIKHLLICSVGLAAAASMRRASAAVRHVTLVLTAIGSSLVPFAYALLPAWHVPFVHAEENAQGLVGTAQIPAPAPSQAVDPIALVLFLLALCSVVLCGRQVLRLLRLRNVERNLAACSDFEVLELAKTCSETLCAPVKLLYSDEDGSPMTWGVWHPKICLPSNASQWSTVRLKCVLLHELAHVKRKDWPVSVISQFICSIFWFNPLVWVLRSRIEAESESAADDQVLALGVSGPRYADELFGLARDLQAYPKSSTAALGIVRSRRLERRIQAILEEGRSRRRTRASATAGLLAMVGSVVIAVGTAAPTVVRTLGRRFAAVAELPKATHKLGPPQVKVVSVRPGADFIAGAHRGPTVTIREAGNRAVVKAPVMPGSKPKAGAEGDEVAVLDDRADKFSDAARTGFENDVRHIVENAVSQSEENDANEHLALTSATPESPSMRPRTPQIPRLPRVSTVALRTPFNDQRPPMGPDASDSDGGESSANRSYESLQRTTDVAPDDKFSLGKTVTLLTQPSQRYASPGPQRLVDGNLASADFRDGRWLGWDSTDFDAVLDLGAPKRISQVGLHCLQDTRSWIVMPTMVRYETSMDGAHWKSFGEVASDVRPSPEDDALVEDWFTAQSGAPVKAKYVRVTAKNYGKLPPWHPGASMNGYAFIFVDQLAVG